MVNTFAEDVGFEPTEPFSSTVFKTAAIDHSANLPNEGNHLQLITFVKDLPWYARPGETQSVKAW